MNMTMRRMRRQGAMARGLVPAVPENHPPCRPFRKHGRLPSRRGERGFVTIFALGLAACLSITLGLAMQANTSLQNLNRQQAERLQVRAATVPLR